VVKEEITPLAEIPEKMRPLLEEFNGVVHDELPEGLPPMRDIQHVTIPDFNHLELSESSLNQQQ